MSLANAVYPTNWMQTTTNIFYASPTLTAIELWGPSGIYEGISVSVIANQIFAIDSGFYNAWAIANAGTTIANQITVMP